MIAAAVLAAAVGLAGAEAPTSACHDALDILYDGSTDTALERFRALVEEFPQDPMAAYLEALALSWKIEQRPQSTDLDRDLHARLDAILSRTSERLRLEPGDRRARLARGGAFGLRSRFYLFRYKARDAAKAAQGMRSELLKLADDPAGRDPDVDFGLGLYDYYVDVLPRVAKLIRFLSGMPGGARARGLLAIERAKENAVFHQVEAAWQLSEIYTYYEDKPDLAWAEMRRLHDEYPGAPLWALKLAEIERDRLGRYAEAAAHAREVVRASERGEPNYGPVAAALGRLAVAEALLLDLRLADARRALVWFRDGFEPAPWLALRSRLLLGRLLELEGDREAALVHYRAAALSTEKDVRDRAQRALGDALPAGQVRAVPHLAEARRAREAARANDSVKAYREALTAWPDCAEARLRIAEHELREGRAALGRRHLARLLDEETYDPAWIKPWTWLLQGWTRDLDDDREAAVFLYKKVLQEPYRDEGLAREARSRLRQPFRRPPETVEAPEAE